VTPFRSGVANHTTELARAVAARRDTSCAVFSFSRQYPRLLFPGQDDRAADAKRLENPRAEYAIDAINPFSWQAAAHRIRRWMPDIVIIPAWTFFLAPCLGWIARALRRAGVPVVAVVHNVADHEAAGWKRAASVFQLRQASGYVTHNEQLRRQLIELVGPTRVRVHPHPIFSHFPEPEGPAIRRAPLELLFFGLIRPYKGLDIALRAAAKMRRRDFKLSIVGEFWDGRRQAEALIATLGLAEQVDLVPRYVSDREAATCFARADAVILPYRSVSGSGVIPLAYRYGKPVVVSDLAGLTEMVSPGSTGWIVPVDDPDALAQLLDTEVTAERAIAMAAGIQRTRQSMSWESFAEAAISAAHAEA
jgi:glycosyltransferase involved in cell wall biosynthesis